MRQAITWRIDWWCLLFITVFLAIFTSGFALIHYNRWVHRQEMKEWYEDIRQGPFPKNSKKS